MNKVIAFLLVTTMMASVSLSYSKERGNSSPTIEAENYLYKNCKESIGTERFQSSPCRTAIVSFFVGSSLAIQSSPFYDPDPICNAKLTAVVETFQKRFCGLPDKDFEKIALEYVSWYEGQLQSKESLESLKKKAI